MNGITTDTVVVNEKDEQLRLRIDDNLLMRIECDLEFYEKVSLVFLLYDDSNVALQDLLLVEQGSTKQLLPQWANTDDNWKEKLLESLCLIQNYCILKREFGISKEEAYVKYLPFQTQITNFLPKWKKAIYRICEDLDASKKTQLLNEIRKSNELPNYNFDYFEMFFIYLQTAKLISNGNLSSLLPMLKVVDYEHFYEIISKLEGPSNKESNKEPERDKIQDESDMGRLNKDRIPDFRSNSDSLSEGASIYGQVGAQTPSSSAHDNDLNAHDYYYMDQESPGVCLIINNEFFYTDQRLYNPEHKELYPLSQKLDTRVGSSCDRDALATLFAAMRYHVRVHENLTAEDVLATVTDTADSVRADSSLFVFLLSHGLDQLVFGSNSMPVRMADLRRILYTRNGRYLMGKPKVLVIQACQGQRCQDLHVLDSGLATDGPNDSDSNGITGTPIPKTRDVCELYASVAGYSAIRATRTGSWLIQSLCANIRKHAHKSHFADICTYVITECSEKKWYKDEEVRVMVPTIHSTFGKKFRLPKIFT